MKTMRFTTFTAALSALTISVSTLAQDQPSTKRTKPESAAGKTSAPISAAAPDAEPDDGTARDTPEEAEGGADAATAEAEVSGEDETTATEPPAAPAPAPAAEMEEVAAAPVTAGATAPAWSPSQCSASEIRLASVDLGSSLVKVEAPGASGLGFVFYSRSHVLTPASLVDTGRGIRVRFDDDGAAVGAKVVAYDEANDLALLELDSPAPGQPLALGSKEVAPGDPVMTVLRSSDYANQVKVKDNRHYLRARREHMRRYPDTVVETGAVTFSRANRLRTSALREGHGHWGAPILDCAGGLVGMATSPISDEATGFEAISAISNDVADEAVYYGRWSAFSPHAALVGQLDHKPRVGFNDRDAWLGFSVGNALIAYDRLFLPARFTATFLVGPEMEQPLDTRSGYRLQGSLGVGYRIMLKGGAVPFYLVPVIGGTVMYERIETQRTELWVDAPCPDGGCRATPFVSREIAKQTRVMPTFGGGMQIGAGELSYQFILDTEQNDLSTHQVSLGVQF